jgi:hypothetical protein
MADWDVVSSAPGASTPAQPDPWAVVSHEPHDSGLSTGAKVGLGAGATALAALALKFPELREAASNLAERARAGVEPAPLWAQAGLRTAEDAPIARNLAGPSGMEALRLHTAEVSRTIAANEAGIPAGQAPILSNDILADARRMPNSVYDRAANAVPAGPLSPDAQKLVLQGGLPGEGRVSQGSPQAQAQIEALRQQLLAPTNAKGGAWTGQNWVNEMRGLRQEGFTNVASDDVSNQQLGRAQLAFARAVEQHIGGSIPTGADVTPEQFWAARKTLAKNFTIQNALRGGDVDLQALARIQRADPEMLDGGTKMLADFGANHPEVASLPTNATRYNPPGVAQDIKDVKLTEPASWLRPALGELARRSLVGNTEDAVFQANQMFPPRMPGSFSPPIPPPPSRFGGYLPAPATVDAGGGATTLNTLDNLGLTPDVRAAGSQHPAAARLQALREQLSRPPMQEVDFQGPQKWGDFSLTPQQPVASALQAEAVPFENVLEQGGTQGKPVAGIRSGYRPAPQSRSGFDTRPVPEGTPGLPPGRGVPSPVGASKAPNMRTPEGAPELTEYTPYTPSDAQTAFRNQQAAARLRKVAGDLSVEGPGGSTGTMLDRVRAALERQDRGYAEGGEVVRGSSSPGSPGFMGAARDALAALKDYFVDRPRRELQSQREQLENAIVDDTTHGRVTSPSGDYAAGGTVPGAEDLQAIERQLSDLVATHEAPAQYGDGGQVVLHPKQPLPDALARLAAIPSAGADPAAQDAYLNRARVSVGDPLASLMRVRAILDAQPTSPQTPAAHADGGSVDDSDSSVHKLADAARAFHAAPESPTDPYAERRARVAANLASLVYGLDAQGRPALGGRAWTSTQGGTPAGVLDALTAVPHNLVQLGKTIDKYLPGQSNPTFWDSIDPSWSSDATRRLSQLRQRMQQSAGVAPAQSFGDEVTDIVTDPAMLAPMGAAKATDKAGALRRLLNWSAGGTETPSTTAAVQGVN